MRQKNEIEKKLTELYDKRLKLRLKKYLKKSFMNCCYNERILLHSSNVNKVGCCKNENKFIKGEVVICNDDEQACFCEYYCNKNDRQNIEERFIEEISDPKICGQKEPKIAVLLWVLHANKVFPEEIKIGVFKKICKKIMSVLHLNGCV